LVIETSLYYDAPSEKHQNVELVQLLFEGFVPKFEFADCTAHVHPCECALPLCLTSLKQNISWLCGRQEKQNKQNQHFLSSGYAAAAAAVATAAAMPVHSTGPLLRSSIIIFLHQQILILTRRGYVRNNKHDVPELVWDQPEETSTAVTILCLWSPDERSPS
jgi:hypothetical protein